MTTRRPQRRHPDVEADAALARRVLEAAAEVTGAPVDDLLGYGRMHSEMCAVRLAAAAALVGAGWSNERVVRHLHVDRGHLVDGGLVGRMRRNAPRLLEAAERVAGTAMANESSRRVARTILAEEAAAAGLDEATAATSNVREAVLARALTAARLYGRNYSGPEIADAMGCHTNTSYEMIRRGREHLEMHRDAMARMLQCGHARRESASGGRP